MLYNRMICQLWMLKRFLVDFWVYKKIMFKIFKIYKIFVEMGWYRESYVLTLGESANVEVPSTENESFDVSQMGTGKFESFTEVRQNRLK